MKSVALCFFFFSSRRRHTRSDRDWSSDVCSSDLANVGYPIVEAAPDGTFEITKHPGTGGGVRVGGGGGEKGFGVGEPPGKNTPPWLFRFPPHPAQPPGEGKGCGPGVPGGTRTDKDQG